jgi:chaperonin GroEL
VAQLLEVELKDKKLRIEDALNATRAAVLKVTLPAVCCPSPSTSSFEKIQATGDEKTGVEIVKRALKNRFAKSLQRRSRRCSYR